MELSREEFDQIGKEHEEEFSKYIQSFFICENMKEFKSCFNRIIKGMTLKEKSFFCVLLMEMIENKIELFENIQEFIINQPENKPE